MHQHMNRSKPRKRTSESFDSRSSRPPKLTSTSTNQPFPRHDNVPLADNPYARLTSTIYAGGQRNIFRNRAVPRRNFIVLATFGILCAFMIVGLIAFFIGRDTGIAEAGTSSLTESETAAVSPDPSNGAPTTPSADS